MKRYLKIANVNIKINLLPHVLIAILMCVFAPGFMGVENLDQYQVAKIVEIYLSLMGIVLLLPVFLPDSKRDIRDLIASKKESMIVLHFIRMFQALVFITILGIAFLLYLRVGESEFNLAIMLYTLLATAVFLGGMGMLIFSLFDQVAFAYMMPLTYYIFSFGASKKYLGNIYLFSMQSGSITEKHYLLLLGAVMIILAIGFRDIKIGFKK